MTRCFQPSIRDHNEPLIVVCCECRKSLSTSAPMMLFLSVACWNKVETCDEISTAAKNHFSRGKKAHPQPRVTELPPCPVMSARGEIRYHRSPPEGGTLHVFCGIDSVDLFLVCGTFSAFVHSADRFPSASRARHGSGGMLHTRELRSSWRVCTLRIV